MGVLNLALSGTPSASSPLLSPPPPLFFWDVKAQEGNWLGSHSYVVICSLWWQQQCENCNSCNSSRLLLLLGGKPLFPNTEIHISITWLKRYFNVWWVCLLVHRWFINSALNKRLATEHMQNSWNCCCIPTLSYTFPLRDYKCFNLSFWDSFLDKKKHRLLVSNMSKILSQQAFLLPFHNWAMNINRREQLHKPRDQFDYLDYMVFYRPCSKAIITFKTEFSESFLVLSSVNWMVRFWFYCHAPLILLQNQWHQWNYSRFIPVIVRVESDH